MKSLAFYLRPVFSMAILWLPFLMYSCETDSYETGEGEYSLMRGDLCDLSVNSLRQATAFVTDDGDSYQLDVPYAAKWIQTPDSTYRTLIYYNKVSAGVAQLVNIGTVVTLGPIPHWRMENQTQDPMGLESAWISKNGKYLNLGLLMKTGRISDEELPHNIAVVQDTLCVRDDGKCSAYYRFLHSQNGIPEYYTNRRFVSILLPDEKPDTIYFNMMTYDGVLTRVFVP